MNFPHPFRSVYFCKYKSLTSQFHSYRLEHDYTDLKFWNIDTSTPKNRHSSIASTQKCRRVREILLIQTFLHHLGCPKRWFYSSIKTFWGHPKWGCVHRMFVPKSPEGYFSPCFKWPRVQNLSRTNAGRQRPASPIYELRRPEASGSPKHSLEWGGSDKFDKV